MLSQENVFGAAHLVWYYWIYFQGPGQVGIQRCIEQADSSVTDTTYCPESGNHDNENVRRDHQKTG